MHVCIGNAYGLGGPDKEWVQVHLGQIYVGPVSGKVE